MCVDTWNIRFLATFTISQSILCMDAIALYDIVYMPSRAHARASSAIFSSTSWLKVREREKKKITLMHRTVSRWEPSWDVRNLPLFFLFHVIQSLLVKIGLSLRGGLCDLERRPRGVRSLRKFLRSCFKPRVHWDLKGFVSRTRMSRVRSVSFRFYISVYAVYIAMTRGPSGFPNAL